MNASEFYQAGKLRDAIAAAVEGVRQRPTDAAVRALLCQLLCIAGDLDRADVHLDALMHQDSPGLPGWLAWRQLVRAEKSRQEFFTAGRLPEFLAEPSSVMRLHVEASIRLREGHTAEAAAFLDQAERERVAISGTCDRVAFSDFRDLDDLTACFFEVLTTNGKYYWVGFEQVEEIQFHRLERPLDLLWRPARLSVRGGPDGEVCVPVLYAGTHAEEDDQLRLGRATEWRGGDDGPARGVGQRTFYVGETDMPMLEIQELKFNEPPVAP